MMTTLLSRPYFSGDGSHYVEKPSSSNTIKQMSTEEALANLSPFGTNALDYKKTPLKPEAFQHMIKQLFLENSNQPLTQAALLAELKEKPFRVIQQHQSVQTLNLQLKVGLQTLCNQGLLKKRFIDAKTGKSFTLGPSRSEMALLKDENIQISPSEKLLSLNFNA